MHTVGVLVLFISECQYNVNLPYLHRMGRIYMNHAAADRRVIIDFIVHCDRLIGCSCRNTRVQ